MIVNSKHLARYLAPVSKIHLQNELAHKCFKLIDDLKADVYVAHMEEALPAALLLKKETGGTVVLDQVEVPEFHNRNHRFFNEEDSFDIYSEFYAKGLLPKADKVMTVSWPLESYLRQTYNVKNTITVANYPYDVVFTKNDKLRQMAKASKNDVLVLYPNNIYESFKFEEVIEIFSQLPKKFKLVNIGFVPQKLQERYEEKINNMGLRKRIKLLGRAPYSELHSLASGADFAFIYRDDRILNNYVALPNRFFDSILARLPLLCYDGPHMVEIIDEYGIGESFSYRTPQAEIVDKIKHMADNLHQYKTNVKSAANSLIWEKQEKNLISFLGDVNSVTFIGIRSLINNNRTIRMANTLTALDVKVNIITTAGQQDNSLRENINWFSV